MPEVGGIGVIIVTHQSAAELPRCLESLLTARRDPADRPAEILVVDNASRDQSRAIAERAAVRRLDLPRNLGYGRAANRALDQLRTPYALLCNPDVWFPDGSIAALRGFMREHPECEVQGPRMEDEAGTLLYSCRRWPTWRAIAGRRLGGFAREVDHHLMQDYDHATPRRVDWVSGACMLFPADFRFDPRYFLYVEDVDFCYDKRVFYNPAATVGHRVGRASARNPRLMGQHLISMARFFHKRGHWAPPIDSDRPHDRRGRHA
jgi:N-acetylglucosaminyl-diphospho-decaprenol L-rhamnosyltransferase